MINFVGLCPRSSRQGCRITFARGNMGFRDSTDCTVDKPATNQSACIGEAGGVFDRGQSNTWATAPDGTWGVATVAPLPVEGAHSHYGYDNIVIGAKELTQVPIVT